MKSKRNQPSRHHAVRNGRPGHLIFRASRRNWKTGEIEYAKDLGLKAFAIWVPDDPEGGQPSTAACESE